MHVPSHITTPAPSDLNDWILTYHEDTTGEAFNLPYSSFLRVMSANYTGTDDATQQHDLGFSLKIGTNIFNKIAITRYGTIVLGYDSSTEASDAYGTSATPSQYRYTAKIKTTSQPAFVLAPWAGDVAPVPNSFSQYQTITDAQQQNILQGLTLPSVFSQGLYNESNGGVFLRAGDVDSIDGLRTIVRWNCLTTSSLKYSEMLGASNVTFECAIHANGKIKFNYAPLHPVNVLSSDSERGFSIAAIGPGSNNIRDFSTYVSESAGRLLSDYGGAIYESSTTFLSNLNALLGATQTTKFDSRLTTLRHWPARRGRAGVFTFQPPPNKSFILPRREVRRYNSLRSDENRRTNEFDDRNTLLYTTANVSHPTRIPRFHGTGDVNVTLRQDLFTNDIVATSSPTPSTSDHFMIDNSQRKLGAFYECGLHEIDNATQFYLTGTTVGVGFEGGLKNKTIFRFELPIATSTTLPPTTSSVYYYNNGAARLEMPAPDEVERVGGTGVTDVPQDHKLFGPIGNFHASGSTFLGVAYSDANENATLLPESTSIMGSKFINIKSAYNANGNLSFSPNITSPFLVEKVVFELPIEAGDGWFKDITRTFKPYWQVPAASGFDYADNSMDFGGPALTISLLRQFNLPDSGKTSFSTNSIRSIVTYATITHQADATTSSIGLAISGTIVTGPVVPENAQVYLQGFNAFGVSPDVVITPVTAGTSPNYTYSYTGSIKCEVPARSGAGNVIGLYANFNGTSATGGTATGLLAATTGTINLVSSSSIALSASWGGSRKTNIVTYKPYGRNDLTIISPSVSYFGNDYTRGQIGPSSSIGNPFYIPDVNDPSSVYYQLSQLQDNKMESAFFRGAVYNETIEQSPAIIYPSDRLIVSLSKTRPVYGQKTSNSDYEFKGNHDIKIPTGRMRVTIYGSYVRNGTESHETRFVGSHAIQGVFCDEPLVDQFDIETRYLLTDSYVDDYVTGSIASDRKKLFFKATRSGTDPIDTSTLARSLVQIKELNNCSTNRNIVLSDETERYYDSLLPSIDEMFAADGRGFSDLNNYSFAIIDPAAADAALGNYAFSKSFPYANQYSALRRHPNPTLKGHNYPLAIMWSDSAGNKNIMFDAQDSSVSSLGGLLAPSSNDIIKTLFGVGNVSTYHSSTGSVNFVDFRFVKNSFSISPDTYTLNVYPIIRGWKYGIINGVGAFSKTVWRRDRYGQHRDMLEQRQYTKFFKDNREGLAAVSVKFVDSDGNVVRADATQSSNLTSDASSVLPYFDGLYYNRENVEYADVGSEDLVIVS